MPTSRTPILPLRDIRERAGWSQAQLAVYSGVSISAVARLEDATDHDTVMATSLRMLVHIGDSLGVPAVKLYPRLSKVDPEVSPDAA